MGKGGSGDDGGGRRVREGNGWKGRAWGGEIGLDLPAMETDGGGIIGTGDLLDEVEGAELDMHLLRRVADLHRELPPQPLLDAVESDLRARSRSDRCLHHS